MKRSISNFVRDNTNTSREYIKNWFGADSFFKTRYESNVLYRKFFIISIRYNDYDDKIFLIKEICETSIQTYGNEYKSLIDARTFLDQSLT